LPLGLLILLLLVVAAQEQLTPLTKAQAVPTLCFQPLLPQVAVVVEVITVTQVQTVDQVAVA
jgi:hypothetical protein